MGNNTNLPFIGSSSDVASDQREDHWRSVFGEIWGPVDIKAVTDGQISGSLRSKKVGGLSVNCIEFGNQQFERSRSDLKRLDEPFYSLSFPDDGEALCQIGDMQTRLVPQNAYLLNNNIAAKLRVEKNYSTFNIKIPMDALEHRLGRNASILSRPIIQPDAIYHMMQRLIAELIENVDNYNDQTAGFLTNQMLDTVAFFLTTGGGESEDSIAVQAIKATIIAFIDSRFRDTELTPETVAKACGISRSYLYKIFSEGPSVMERIRKRRLVAARGMIELRTASLSMTEVAMVCGFSNSSEFSRLFKIEFGVVPSKM
ncbi:MAG: AraC family transcriptional regulator [Sneathiella sp.]